MKYVLGVLIPGALMMVSGCTPAFIHGKQGPKATIKDARPRLQEHGITLDTAGTQAGQLRSILYCFRDADNQGFQWRRAFGVPAPPLIRFEREGAQSEQDAIRETCPIVFRIAVIATAHESGSRMTVESEWWALEPGACTPVGNPLVGRLKCTYRYRGTRPVRDVRSYIYGMLRDL
ncbi:MAG: hypothetical protein VX589_16210 [Myxococcota bacterium]|nr:hypothetical protein [Myxococcota bacterium]